MITVSKQENGVLFAFQDSDKYLYGSGTIEVPFNSLSIIQDESDNITLRKSASNDIFLSARYDTDFGYVSKEEAVNALKEILYDEAGISEEEVQQMIDAATSGIPSSQVVEQLRTDVNAVSGEVDTLQDDVADIWDTIDEKEEVIASALTEVRQDVADIDAKEEVIASALTEVRQDVENKQDALTAGSGIEISGNVISATGGALFVDFDDLMNNMNDEKWDELVDALQNNKPIFYDYDYSDGDITDAGQSPVDGYVYINEGEESTEIGLKQLYGGGYRELYIVKNGSEDYEVSDDSYDYQPFLQAGSGINIEDNVISVTVDSELDETSNNPVANSAITNAIINNEYTVSQAINSLNNRVAAVESGGTGGGITSGEVQTMIDDSLDIYWTSAQTQSAINAATSGKADTSAVTAVSDALTAHTANTTVHVTSAEKTAWNAKQDALYIYTEDNNLGTAELHSNDSSIIFNAGGASITANNAMGVNTFNVASTGVTINGENVLTDGIISTAITSGSTDAQVPTAKATYDAIQAGGTSVTVDPTLNTDSTNPVANSAITTAIDAKADKTGCLGTLAISNQSPSTQFKSSLVTYNANGSGGSTQGYFGGINGKAIAVKYTNQATDFQLVEKSAITSSITSGSTDSEIPTAKATYDAIQAGGGGGATYSAGTNISIANDTINCTLPIFVKGNQNNSLSLGSDTNTINNSTPYVAAFGQNNNVAGYQGFASGYGNKTLNTNEATFGKYSKPNYSTSSFGNAGNTLFTIGNGTGDNDRHNAFEVRQNGDIYIALNGQDVKLQDQLGGGGGVTVDPTLDSGSTNPVANSAITAAIDGKQNALTAGTGISISNNVISTSGVVMSQNVTQLVKLTQAAYDALATKDSSTLYIISD